MQVPGLLWSIFAYYALNSAQLQYYAQEKWGILFILFQACQQIILSF